MDPWGLPSPSLSWGRKAMRGVGWVVLIQATVRWEEATGIGEGKASPQLPGSWQHPETLHGSSASSVEPGT